MTSTLLGLYALCVFIQLLHGLSVDLDEFENNLVPYPEIHFILALFAPGAPIVKISNVDDSQDTYTPRATAFVRLYCNECDECLKDRGNSAKIGISGCSGDRTAWKMTWYNLEGEDLDSTGLVSFTNMESDKVLCWISDDTDYIISKSSGDCKDDDGYDMSLFSVADMNDAGLFTLKHIDSTNIFCLDIRCNKENQIDMELCDENSDELEMVDISDEYSSSNNYINYNHLLFVIITIIYINIIFVILIIYKRFSPDVTDNTDNIDNMDKIEKIQLL